MNISYNCLNRWVEQQMLKDAVYRREMERSDRPLLSRGRAMSDEALLLKLQSLGLDAAPELLLDRFPRFASAQKMSDWMLAHSPSRIPDKQADWIWIALTCLWERWRPDLANTEMVDDKMQAGYAALAEGDTCKACRLWLDVWRAILDVMARSGEESLDAFDERFGGNQSVFNWLQDLEVELHNAGLREPQFFRERIAVCETILVRFSASSLPIANFMAALAQSHFELGERETGDGLFRRWLTEDSSWGGGWIAWSDCYGLFATQCNKDAVRAEDILKEGLAVPDVVDREFILERCIDLYENIGRSEDAARIRQELKQAPSPTRKSKVRSIKEAFAFGKDARPLDPLPDLTRLTSDLPTMPELTDTPTKVGRNDPCPCGSGKKYKKCCGRG